MLFYELGIDTIFGLQMINPLFAVLSLRMATAIVIAPGKVGLTKTLSGVPQSGHQLPGCSPAAAELNRASSPFCTAKGHRTLFGFGSSVGWVNADRGSRIGRSSTF